MQSWVTLLPCQRPDTAWLAIRVAYWSRPPQVRGAARRRVGCCTRSAPWVVLCAFCVLRAFGASGIRGGARSSPPPQREETPLTRRLRARRMFSFGKKKDKDKDKAAKEAAAAKTGPGSNGTVAAVQSMSDARRPSQLP
jgi:hypothetical protein